MKITTVFSLLFGILVLLLLTEGVERSKFKTCQDSSFCQRNRNFGNKFEQKSEYMIVEDSIKQVSEYSVIATIRNLATGINYPTEFSGYKDGIFRMIIREQGVNRYEVTDSLVKEKQDEKIHWEKESDTLWIGDRLNGNRVDVRKSPFGLTVWSNGQKVMEINKRGLMKYEEHREKGENEESGAWDERFGSHTDSKPKGPTSIGVDITFFSSKHLFGLPEHTTDFSLKPTRSRSSEDPSTLSNLSEPYRLYNLDVFEYELNEPMALYGSIPLLISHKGDRTVGALWLNPSETWVDIIKDQDDPDSHTHWYSESGVMDLLVFFGPTPKDFFKQYAQMTGVTPLPQKFALGYHQCKWNYKDEADVLTVNQRLDESDIPYDVIWLDIEHTNGKRYFTWDSRLFPNPIEMQEKLNKYGRKLVTIIDPHIKKDSGYEVWREANGRDLFIKSSKYNPDEGNSGESYEGGCWPGGSSWPDFIEEKVRDWWSEWFSYDKYDGSTDILYVWNDMNEPSVFTGPEVTMNKDTKHLSGREHREVHNIYGFYHHMATYHALIKRSYSNLNENKNSYNNEDGIVKRIVNLLVGSNDNSVQNNLNKMNVVGGGDRPFVLSRSFFVGSQRWGAIWTGDNEAQWGHLAVAQPMLLSLSVSGISFVGADIGGFNKHPSPELLTRWYQAASLQPFFRSHAHLDSPRREPYLYTDPHFTVMRSSVLLRYSFIDYIYTTFYVSTVTGLPVMRPLWVEYPNDAQVWSNQDQFLIGRDIMVRPIVSEGEKSCTVYLPGKDVWWDILTEQIYSPATIPDDGMVVMSTPLHYFPVFQRGGSIVARKLRTRRSTKMMENDPYTLYAVLNKDKSSEGVLYVDDGKSFDYLIGEYCVVRFDLKGNRMSSVAQRNPDLVYSSPTTPTSKQLQCTYQTQQYIERIIIVGVTKQPSKVILSSFSVPESLQLSSTISSSLPKVGSELNFEYDWRKQVVVVRKPLLPITSDWSFELS